MKSTKENEVLKGVDYGYPLYLFSMLWHNAYPEHEDLEYDLSYGKIVLAWREFIGSRYDNDHVSLYDCILEFFKSKRVGES